MKNLIAALGLAAVLGATGAIAQTATTAESDQITGAQGSLDVIRGQLETGFAQLGVDREVGSLTMDQAAEAYLIVSDESMSDDEKIQQIQALD